MEQLAAVDSLLAAVISSSSDDEDDNSAVYRRTVDEIINSSSSSSPFSSRSASPVIALSTAKSALDPSPSLSRSNSETLVAEEEVEEEADTAPSSLSERSSHEPSTATPLRYLELRGQSIPRNLPPLFGRVRSSPKPGAALAAAAAASRLVPTPHAAAIKSRRNVSAGNLEDFPLEMEVVGVEESGGLERSRSLDVADVGLVVESSRLSSVGLEDGVPDGGRVSESSHPDTVLSVDKRVEGTEKYVDSGETSVVDLVDSNVISESGIGKEDFNLVEDGDGGSVSDEENFHSLRTCRSAYSTSGPSSDTVEQLDVHSPSPHSPSSSPHPSASETLEDSQLPLLEGNIEESLKLQEMQVDNHNVDPNDGEAGTLLEKIDSKSGAVDLPDQRKSHLSRSEKTGRKEEKKLRASMKPLEWAEEIEKRQASSGLHWEEGAVSQPMRLEGIRKDPPAVGYLQIDPENALTSAISSQAFQRDHGSPQVLATHMNFIAIGLSKGLVLVMPSKYSPYSADRMDSKMLMFSSEGEKSLSPVTSMCFNQQGDLLLVGYGDGHFTLWDTQKATAAKVITGEHTAPVVHTAFLGQDPQTTRQFITGDSKGIVLLHSISVVLFLFTIKTQRLLDGKRTGTVLSVSPLLMDDLYLGGLTSAQGNSPVVPGLGSMVGGVVGGVVGGEAGWKFFKEGPGPLAVEEGVVIFVTYQNALVVRLSPSLEVYKNLSKPEGVREGSIPYTAWKCSPFARGSSKDHAAVIASDSPSWLVIAWDRKILVHKLVQSKLIFHKEWSIDCEAIGVAWLDDQMLVILTSRRNLCLYSRDGVGIHDTSLVFDGIGVGDIISYHTYFTNLFGNPEKAYHNSVAVRGATIYILGPIHLLISRLLPWKERIQVLQRAGDWMGALDMSMRLYDGHAHGVVDLPRTVDTIRETIMPFLVELLLAYVDEVFSYILVSFCNQSEKNVQLTDQNARSKSVDMEMEQYARVGGVAVEFCLHIKRTDILFDVIFSKFESVQQGGAFLEILEPYVLKDMLGSLPPEIMQSLVEHYKRKGWLQRVEQCILHMDISSLDFNQVVRLCREHGLYGALIYLFNQGLDDYKTPLEELLMVVQNLQRKEAAAIGYRMLIYLKYCFLGLAFPPGHGSISLSRLPSLRLELLQFLLEDSRTLNSGVTKKYRSSCGACLNIFYLIWLDIEATLEVLRCAFLNDARTKSGNLSENMDEKRENSCVNSSNQVLIQNFVNSLILCFNLESNEIRFFNMDGGSLEVWPSEKEIGYVFEFIVYFIACKQATVSGEVLKHILEYLSSNGHSTEEASQKIKACQKEKQLIALLQVVPEEEWDTSQVLDLCLKAQYYQACGIIYTIRKQYINALDSYMKDLDEPVHAFAFIHKMMPQLKEADHSSFRSSVVSRLPDLVRISREGTFFLVVDQLSEESQHTLSYFQPNPQGLFLFLKTIIDIHLQGKLDFSALKQYHHPFRETKENESDDVKVYLESLSDLPKILRQTPIHVTDEVTELYLELLCQYERGSVLKFLETFENYRLEHCLRLCQDYKITDASAFLLERAGDVAGAFTVAVDGLHENFDRLASYVQNLLSKATVRNMIDVEHANAIMQRNEFLMVDEVLQTLIGLCRRNTHRLDSQESESLWLRLLDTFCEPLRELYHDTEVSNGKGHATRLHETHKIHNRVLSKSSSILRRLFSQFIKEIVEGMVGYIPLPTIMAKLLADNRNQEFGDFKFTILGMLGTYGFERRILDTAKSLIEEDMFYTMSLLKKEASQAYSPQSFVCCICGWLLTKESSASGIRVYNCGHAMHLHCESQENEPSEKVGTFGCIICMPKSKNYHVRNKMAAEDSGLIRNSMKSKISTQGSSSVHQLYEPEQMEKTCGLQHVSRFEMLSNLQKSRRPLKFDGQPQLRLAPPALYHEKVQKGTGLLLRDGSPIKSERSNKSTHETQTRQRGLSKRFPLKSSLFGTEKSRIPRLPGSRK